MSDAKRAAIGAGAGATAAVIALAAALIAPWEGKRNTPYADPIGILTVCYGHTGKDIERRKYSDAECMAMLSEDVRKHAKALECTDGRFTLPQGAAFVSLAYNIGVAGFCRSSAAKAAQAGDYVTACAKIDLHVKAGGKVLQGLVDRRAFERAICEGDFAQAEAIAKRKGLKGLAQAVADIQAVEEATEEEAKKAAESAASAPETPQAMPTPSSPEKPASAPIFGFLGGCTCSAC